MQGKIEEVYQELVKDEEKKDEISLDGLMAIYEVLELSGTDLETYLFNFQCRAKSAEKMTHQEFLSGMIRMGCESLEAVKEKLPSLREDLQDKATFKEFYLFCFDFSKEQETHKYLSLEVAIAPHRGYGLGVGREWIKGPGRLGWVGACQACRFP